MYDRWGKHAPRYERGELRKEKGSPRFEVASLDDAELVAVRWARGRCATLKEELDAARGGARVRPGRLPRAGEVTPVFFGSAVNDFGVEPFLAALPRPGPAAAAARNSTERPRRPAPAPLLRLRLQDPGEHGPRPPRPRRLRAGLLREVHARHGGDARADGQGPQARTSRSQFLAQERTLVEEAWAGDILGLWDPGNLRIGDTLARGRRRSSTRASPASRPSTSTASSCSTPRSESS